MRGAFRLGRQIVAGEDARALFPVLVRMAHADRADPEIDNIDCWRIEEIILPAIDMAFDLHKLFEDRHGRTVQRPAVDFDDVADLPRLDRNVLHFGAAERRRMYETDMRRVEQIVGQLLIVRCDVGIRAVIDAPVRVPVGRQIEQQRFVGLFRFAGPHPDQAEPFGDWIRPHANVARYERLAGNFPAGASGIVLQPVIAALDAVAAHPAFRQGQELVGAAVFQRPDRSVAGTKRHDRLAEQLPADRTVVQLVQPCNRIPAVAYESAHAASALSRAPG